MRKLDLCVKNLDLCVENLEKSVENLEKSVKNGFKILQGSFTGPYDGLAKTLALTYDSMKNNNFLVFTQLQTDMG